MRLTSKRALAAITAIAAALVCIAAFAVYLRARIDRPQNGHYGDLSGWQTISGRWSAADAVLSNSNYGRGDMLIAQHSNGKNYRVSADIRFDFLFSETHYGDAGLVFRATDPEKGVDSYRGYYAGVRPDSQTLVLGRASYDWRPLSLTRLAAPVSPSAWYHMEVSVKGCDIAVVFAPLEPGPQSHANFHDDQCLQEGAVGLRSFYAQASWRNVKIEPL